MKRKLLFAIVALLCSVVADAQATYNFDYKNGVEVGAGENYFLYNIGTRQFLTSGLNYGTRATVDNSGRVLKLTVNNNGYSIYTDFVSLNNREENTRKAGYLTTNGYVDTGTNDADWVFTHVDVDGYTNVYTIKNSDTQYLFFDVDNSDPGCPVNVGTCTNNAYSYWLLITKDMREALGDYSHYLINTQMNAAWEFKTWGGSTVWNDNAVFTPGGLVSNRCGERYHATSDVYQEVKENLPNGLYKLYVQGFWRNDGSSDEGPVLYANNDTKTLNLRNGSENSMNAASESFTAGKYVNELITNVVDNKLRVGINITKEDQWVIFDNFVLKHIVVTGSEGGEDITSLLTNPTPTSNGDGWTMSQTPTYDSGNNVAEYWNKSGASLSQTINLPQGYYRLTTIALTRTGMNAPLTVTGATDGALNSMKIATVASSVVNSRAGANTWFNSGYGVNELDFYVPTRQDVTISLTADNSRSDYWLVWRSFQLTAVGNAEENLLNLEQYLDDEALTRANALLNNDSYVHVNGTERTNLQNAVTALTEYAGTGTISEKVDERKALKYALVAPYNTMAPNSVCIAYDEYYYQKEVANSLGIDVSSMNVPTTASEATAIAHNLNISLYNKVASDYQFSLNGLIGDFGSWTGTATVNGEAATPNYLSNEHWSGTTHAYYEQASAGWGSDAWTIKYEKKTTLPAGDYVIKVAARSSGDVTSLVSCSATDATITLPAEGAFTRGINTDGVASWSDGDTFARGGENNEGYGWQWRFLPFTLTEETEVTMTFYAETSKKYNWMSIADGELLSANDVAEAVAYNETANNVIEDVLVANVTMTRNIKKGYNTVCLPFTLTSNQVTEAFGAGTEVYVYTENSENANDVTVNFNKGDGSITANTPVLVKATTASTEQTFNGVQIVAAETATVAGKNFDFIGTYAPIAAIPEGDYFIGNDALYKSAGATSMKAFRAYIKAKTTGGSVKMFIDGENVDAIDAINGEAAEQGAIYNIAGQRVNKAQKGIYIVNGKKVLVK